VAVFVICVSCIRLILPQLNADQDVENYWIRADPSTGTTGFSGGINSAILRYVGADEDSEPSTPEVDATNPLVEANLVPLENPGAPGDPEVGGVDVALNLNFTFVSTVFHLPKFITEIVHTADWNFLLSQWRELRASYSTCSPSNSLRCSKCRQSSP
jgi:hypothetical protein